MFFGTNRDEGVPGLTDKKRKNKEFKDAKKKDGNAPPADRIPMPPLPESVLNERRIQAKEIGKRVKISAENPPSVCLYTILNAPGGVCSAALTENCEMVSIGYGNSVIQVHSLNQKGLPLLKSSSELEQIDIDADAEMNDEIYDHSIKEDIVEFTGHLGPVYSLSYSPDRRLLLSGSRDETVRLWSIEMRRNLLVYRMDSPVLSSVFCSRGYYFAASTASKLVSLYSSERIHPLRLFSSAQEDVTGLDFHPNCNYIVGGSDDHEVYVWDVLNANCVRKFTGHKAPVHTVKVSPDGRFVLSASTDGILNIWDLAQQKLFCTQECSPMPFHVPITFSKDGSVFAMGSPEYAVSFYNFDQLTSYGSELLTAEQRINPEGFNLFSYPTKRTSLLDFCFSRKNTVVGVGAFEV
ncbi:unnamed protein product [Bursaphelenchus xylophilus]|uniref:(pine wood nematode) hypothetical protein n=1 Tax=Bursaphelenchus xylophilus TaxID=6326 RepID=A0A1I7RKZ7_BURXY|nr:unnamed protein product [Bursaphelenchus xylophilus]CAG9083664.1 unnamed protein product [Bursaphelenchus xylophilus]